MVRTTPMAMVRAMVSCTLSSMPPPSSTRLSTTAAMMRQGIDMGPTAPCLDCPKMLYTIGGKMTCPHDVLRRMQPSFRG